MQATRLTRRAPAQPIAIPFTLPYSFLVSESGKIVTIRKLSKLYAQGEIEVTALNSISLDIKAGEFLNAHGPSGSGTPALLHSIAGH